MPPRTDLASSAIARFSYQNYTVTVKPLNHLLVCDLFQGPSYSALRKLDHFFTRLQALPDLYHALTTELSHHLPAKLPVALSPEIKSALQHFILDVFSPANPAHDSEGDR